MTKRRCNGRRKSALPKGDETAESDVKSLQKINSMLDVIERDIVPLTCIAACQGEKTNMVRFNYKS